MLYFFTTGKIINLANTTFGGKNPDGTSWVKLTTGDVFGMTAAELAELQAAIGKVWPYANVKGN